MKTRIGNGLRLSAALTTLSTSGLFKRFGRLAAKRGDGTESEEAYRIVALIVRAAVPRGGLTTFFFDRSA